MSHQPPPPWLFPKSGSRPYEHRLFVNHHQLCTMYRKVSKKSHKIHRSSWTVPNGFTNLFILFYSVSDSHATGITAAYFRELNEICLFEIFNHLSLNDICVMGDVCTQLKFAAQKYFDVMYTAVNLAWLSDDESGQFTLVQAERLLRNFGHLISTITVNTKQLKAPDCKENLLILIEKYCDGILFWNTYWFGIRVMIPLFCFVWISFCFSICIITVVNVCFCWRYSVCIIRNFLLKSHIFLSQIIVFCWFCWKKC